MTFSLILWEYSIEYVVKCFCLVYDVDVEELLMWSGRNGPRCRREESLNAFIHSIVGRAYAFVVHCTPRHETGKTMEHKDTSCHSSSLLVIHQVSFSIVRAI